MQRIFPVPMHFSQWYLIAAVSMISTLTAATVATPNSQQSGTFGDAMAAWLKQRQSQFRERSDFAEIERTIIKPGQSDVVSSGTQTRYCDGRLWFFREVVAGEEVADREKTVLAANSQYAFHLATKSNFGWRLLGTEVSANPIRPWTPEYLKAVFKPASPPTIGLQARFTSTDNMTGPDMTALETYVSQNANWFVDHSERTDPQFGRVVTVTIDARPDTPSQAKTRLGMVQTIVTGSMDFLCEHNWVLKSYYVETKGLDAAGNEVASSKASFESEYDSESRMLVSSVTKYQTSSGYSNEIVARHRRLTAAEEADCRQLCYLNGFGLPEPPGVRWGWPRWLYGLLGVALFGLAVVGYRRFFRSDP